MKTIFTLMTACVLTISFQSKAQFTENFDSGITPLVANCWQNNQMSWTANPLEVINGTGSLYSAPPVNGSVTRDIITPALNVTTSSITVGFNYKLTAAINGGATRTIEIGVLDASGAYTSLHVITLDNSSPVTVQNFSQSFEMTNGIYRLVVKLGGSNGDGNARVIFDDLSISANAKYGPVSHCNSAPVAVNDVFLGFRGITFFGNIETNDNEPDGETMTAAIVNDLPPSQGTISLNANGTFSYTPNPNFMGDAVSFTYRVTDNGLEPLTSNLATVTINLVAGSPVPVRLISFSGNMNNNKVTLQWTVGENEITDQFEVERSFDGKEFNMAALVFSTEKAGAENYYYAENIASDKVFYRLKMADKSGVITYSKVLVFQTKTGAGNDLRILGNPVTDKLTLSFQAENTQPVEIKVIDMSGRTIHQQKVNSSKGINTISISLPATIKTGIYIVDLFDGVNHATGKIVKQ